MDIPAVKSKISEMLSFVENKKVPQDIVKDLQAITEVLGTDEHVISLTSAILLACARSIQNSDFSSSTQQEIDLFRNTLADVELDIRIADVSQEQQLQNGNKLFNDYKSQPQGVGYTEVLRTVIEDDITDLTSQANGSQCRFSL